jgi:hypothetical protein
VGKHKTAGEDGKKLLYNCGKACGKTISFSVLIDDFIIHFHFSTNNNQLSTVIHSLSTIVVSFLIEV